ncbi:MAG: sulfotransferase domain-containing protein [Alphaproteobacteria bacterium]|nr:sulfotransferase domain-containing protein [Alphaproteobacteria bacterium]
MAALLRAQRALQAWRWDAVRAAAPALLAAADTAPAGRLLLALAGAAGRPDAAAVAAVRSAVAGIALFDAYRYFDPILGLDGRSITSTVCALDCWLSIAGHDAFLLEYPKCGRTWLRLMVGRCIERLFGVTLPDATDLAAAAERCPGLPRIAVTHDDDPELKAPAQVARDKRIYRGKRVLLQVRDPRDVVVSYYFQATTRRHAAFPSEPFRGALAQFVRHPTGGIPAIVAFYNAWAAGRGEPARFLLLAYEDLRADTRVALRATLDLVGLPPLPDADLDAVIADCSFARMRALEAAGAIADPRLRPGDPANPESWKVRRGKVGGYRDYLSEDDVAWIDAYLDRHLDDAYARYKRAETARGHP